MNMMSIEKTEQEYDIWGMFENGICIYIISTS